MLVIERDPLYVGGISRTVDYKGFLFDIGGHRFFSKSKEVVALWREILPDDFIERPRLSRIYYNGKFFSYPLKRVRGADQARPLHQRCLHAVLRLCQGLPDRDRHAPSTNGCATSSASGCSRSSSRPTPRRSGAWPATRSRPTGRRSASRALTSRPPCSTGSSARSDRPPCRRRRRRWRRVKTLIESFQYPRKGPGMMWEAAARRIRRAGRPHPDGTRARARSNSTTRASSGASTVAAADGARGDLYGAARHQLGADARTRRARSSRRPISLLHARALRYRDFLTVALMVRKAELFPDNWIYIHDPTREGRPGAEFPLLVAGNGPGRHRAASGSNISASRATGCGMRPMPS